jgi:hypothetical protein
MSMAEYEVWIKGHLSPQIVRWLGDFQPTLTPDGNTILRGSILDEATFYGLMTRCRDLGLTLVAIYPKEQIPMIHAELSALIDATPEKVYGVLIDYRGGHRAILPKVFTDMTVKQGGYGAGTKLHIQMNVYGNKMEFHQVVSEPEPGRVLVEANEDGATITTFIIEPRADGRQSYVTIQTDTKVSTGLRGVIEKWTTPPVMRRIYKEELRNLAEYIETNR